MHVSIELVVNWRFENDHLAKCVILSPVFLPQGSFCLWSTTNSLVGLRVDAVNLSFYMGGLYDAFARSLSSDPAVRSEAENQLNLALQNDFEALVRSILEDLDAVQQVDSISISAVVYLKNAFHSNWLACSMLPGNKASILTHLVKTLNHLCQVVLSKEEGEGPSLSLINNVTTTIGFLLSCEITWQEELVRDIHVLLADSTLPHSVLCGVLCIIELLRHFRWRLHLPGTSAQRSRLIDDFFPRLSEFSGSGDVSCVLLWKIFKAYKLAIAGELPISLQGDDQINTWMNAFLSAITQKSGKSKKWAFENIQRLLHYAISTTMAPDGRCSEQFAFRFTSIVAPETCRIYCQLASAENMESSTGRYILVYFDECLQIPGISTIILDNIDAILRLTYKSIRLTEDDILDFTSNPEDFVYRQFTRDLEMDGFNLTTHSAARNFTGKLAQCAQEHLMSFAQTLAETASGKPTNSMEKVLDLDASLQLMQPFAVSAVPAAVELLNTENSVLACRVCYLVSLSASKLSAETLADVTVRILELVLNPAFSLVVTLEALKALHELLKQNNQNVTSIVEPHAIQILRRLFTMYEADTMTCIEELGDILSDLVQRFSTDLIPHSGELIVQLGKKCKEMVDDLDDASEESQVEEVRAVCSAINAVILAASVDSVYKAQFVSVVASIIHSIFDKREVDLYADAVDMLTNLCSAYRCVDESMWAMFEDNIVPVFQEDAISCAEEALACISAFGTYTTHMNDHVSVFNVLAHELSAGGMFRSKAAIESQITILNGNFVGRFADAAEGQNHTVVLSNPDIVRMLRCVVIREPSLAANIVIRDALLVDPCNNTRDAKIISIGILRALSCAMSNDEASQRLVMRLSEVIGPALGKGDSLQSPHFNSEKPTLMTGFVDESAKFYGDGLSEYVGDWDEDEEVERLDDLLEAFDLPGLYQSFVSALSAESHEALFKIIHQRRLSAFQY